MTKTQIGDLPCYKDGDNIVHITISSEECLCGKVWKYGEKDRYGISNTLLFKDINGVNCEKCKELFLKENK